MEQALKKKLLIRSFDTTDSARMYIRAYLSRETYIFLFFGNVDRGFSSDFRSNFKLFGFTVLFYISNRELRRIERWNERQRKEKQSPSFTGG